MTTKDNLYDRITSLPHSWDIAPGMLVLQASLRKNNLRNHREHKDIWIDHHIGEHRRSAGHLFACNIACNLIEKEWSSITA